MYEYVYILGSVCHIPWCCLVLEVVIYIYNLPFLIPITLPIWIVFPNPPFLLRVILECWFCVSGS